MHFGFPRDLDVLPGFTTNVEFGYWLHDDYCKIVYGRPDNAPKTKYIDWMYGKETDEPPAKSLEQLAEDVIYFLKLRYGYGS